MKTFLCQVCICCLPRYIVYNSLYSTYMYLYNIWCTLSLCAFAGRRVAALQSPLHQINNETTLTKPNKNAFSPPHSIPKLVEGNISRLRQNAEWLIKELHTIFTRIGNCVSRLSEVFSSGGDQGQGWKYTFVRARNTHIWTRVRVWHIVYRGVCYKYMFTDRRSNN